MGQEREEPVGTEVRMEGPWSKKQERRTEQGASHGPGVVLLSEAALRITIASEAISNMSIVL